MGLLFYPQIPTQPLNPKPALQTNNNTKAPSSSGKSESSKTTKDEIIHRTNKV